MRKLHESTETDTQELLRPKSLSSIFITGEKSPQLFPKPVYEEAPFDQREKVIQENKEAFQKNVTSMIKYEKYDIERFNALCRGDELRVRIFT